MTRLPPSIARLITNGDQVAVEDLTLEQVRAIIASTSTALERGRQLAASTMPVNWHEHRDMKALVEWLGGVAELARLRVETEALYTGDFDPGACVRDCGIAAQRDAALRERDEARAERDRLKGQYDEILEHLERHTTMTADLTAAGVNLLKAKREACAERDALAAKLAERDATVRNLEAAIVADQRNVGAGGSALYIIGELHKRADERDAAVARAESAEAKLATAIGCLDSERETLRRVDEAEKRAAALAEVVRNALRTLHNRDMNASMSAWDHLIAGNVKDAMDQIEEVAESMSAALAGNGTTNGAR